MSNTVQNYSDDHLQWIAREAHPKDALADNRVRSLAFELLRYERLLAFASCHLRCYREIADPTQRYCIGNVGNGVNYLQGFALGPLALDQIRQSPSPKDLVSDAELGAMALELVARRRKLVRIEDLLDQYRAAFRGAPAGEVAV